MFFQLRHACSIAVFIFLLQTATLWAAGDVSSLPEDSWEVQNSWNSRNQVESPGQRIRVRWAVSPTPAFLSDNVVFSLEIVHTLDLEWIPPEFADALGDFAVENVQINTPIIEDDREFHKIKISLAPQIAGRNTIGAVPLLFQELTAPLMATLSESSESTPLATVPGSEPKKTSLYIVVPSQEKDIQLSLPTNASIETLHQPSGPIAIPSYLAYYVTGTVCVFVLASVFLFRLVRAWAKMPPPTSPLTLKQIAMKQLTTLLEQRIHERDPKEFYFEITSIVRWFVEQKTDIRAPELTTEEFLQEIAARCDETSTQKTSLPGNLTGASTFKNSRNGNKEKSQFMSLAESQTRTHHWEAVRQGDYEEIEVPYDKVDDEERKEEIKSFFSEKNRASLSSFLEIADLVKFARHQPTHEEMMLAFRKASEFFNLGDFLENEENDTLTTSKTSDHTHTLNEKTKKTGSFGTGAYRSGFQQSGTGSHTRGTTAHNSEAFRAAGSPKIDPFAGTVKAGIFENDMKTMETSPELFKLPLSQDDETKPHR